MKCLLAIALALSLCAVAQDKPDFSGTWQLDVAKSDFGGLASPDSQTNAIQHKGVNIKLNQTIQGEAVHGGETSTERNYKTDGTPTVNKLGPSDAASTATWDGNTLVIVTRLETPDGNLEVKDFWKLESGGKQMVVSREFKNQDGGGTQRLLFQRQ